MKTLRLSLATAAIGITMLANMPLAGAQSYNSYRGYNQYNYGYNYNYNPNPTYYNPSYTPFQLGGLPFFLQITPPPAGLLPIAPPPLPNFLPIGQPQLPNFLPIGQPQLPTFLPINPPPCIAGMYC